MSSFSGTVGGRRAEFISMNPTLKKIWNAVTTVIVAVVVIFALLLVGARVIGLQVYTVLSGSMEPTYHTGSLIYVKSVDPYTITEGTVITFMPDESTIATHRVVGVVPDEEDSTVIRFRTKGDANEAEDGSLVHYKNVIGTPVFTIPYLGYVANYIQNPPGMYVAISAGAILLFLVFLPDIFSSPESGKSEKKPKKQKRRRIVKAEEKEEPLPVEEPLPEEPETPEEEYVPEKKSARRIELRQPKGRHEGRHVRK